MAASELAKKQQNCCFCLWPRAPIVYIYTVTINNMNTQEIKRENLINLYNEKGEKHGYWEVYYENGKLSYKANYVNGQEHGSWERYYGNGQLFYKGNWVNGQQHGSWEEYYENGQLHFKGNYDMGKRVKEVVELTMDEIAEKFGISVESLKIKK